jgi:hypothetical protein
MPHQNSFKERNVSPDRRRRCWIVRDYNSPAQTVVGRVELNQDQFVAIKSNDEVVGHFNLLTEARSALLPQVKHAK